jgi:hypothetical protein
MFYSGNFEITASAANNFTTLGALVVTFSVIAMAEVERQLRFKTY